MVAPITETPTYTLDGWTGNATDGYGVDWIITVEDGWSSNAPVRLATADNAGYDGGQSGPVLLGARLISLKGTAVAADRLTMLAAKERLRAVAMGDRRAAYRLVVAEAHLTRSTLVKHATEIKIADRGSHMFDFELMLRADSPGREGATLLAEGPLTLSVATEAPRATFDAEFPVSFGGTNPGATATVTNIGDADTYPVLAITGPVARPTVANLTAGTTGSYNLTLGAGDILVADHGAKTALVNGSRDVSGLRSSSSSWWALPPGDSEVRFTASSNTAAQLTLTYRPAWK
jgi:hypothetical protein